MTEEYLKWNTDLLEYCCENSVDDQGNVFLTIDSFLEARDEPDAEDRFKQAVRKAFHPPYAHKYENRIRSFIKKDAQRRPLCAALLGICVLAAGDMDSNAYYEHLSSWLACPERDVKKAFANLLIEEAWELLRDYFERCGLMLPPPPPGTGKRYVKLPQHHALLRQIDIRRLADFFYDYNVSPRYHHPDNTLCKYFSSWMTSKPLTLCGMGAWGDSTRQNSVFKQVRDALENWDELSYRAWRKMREQERQRGATESVTRWSVFSPTDSHRFDRIQTLPVRLFWEHGDNDEAYVYFQILRTQANLPSVLPFCGSAFQRRRSDMYSVIPVDSQQRASILLEGCEEWTAGARICFQIDKGASNKSVFIFKNTDGDGYAQAHSLQLGVPSALLVGKQFAGHVSEWLVKASSQVPTQLRLPPFLESDWVLLTDFTLRSAASAPVGFPALHVSTELSAQLDGGLRLDSNHSVWMESAPPRVFFAGSHLPETATVDDTRQKVLTGGFLAPNAIPSAPGEYQVTALAETSRPVRRYIRIEAARLHETRNDVILFSLFGNFGECLEEEKLEKAPTPKMALPEAEPTPPADGCAYHWYLLGASPGQVCLLASPMTREAMQQKNVVDFVPVWGIGRGDQSVIVAPLTATPILPCVGEERVVGRYSPAAERLWTKIIQTTPPRGLKDQFQIIWRTYQACARSRNALAYQAVGHAK